MKLQRTDFIELYNLMIRTRLFEEKASHWYKKGLIKEAPHQCLGQEAIGIGMCYGLEREDQVLPSLRTRSSFFARGVDTETMLLAMAGKKSSPSKGHETSHHAAYPELGVLFGTGMVGSSISIGVGAALALQLQGKKNVVIIFFGDGASNRGDFHEALNLAAIWKLPAVFVCENNGIALSTKVEDSMCIDSVAIRALGYGMPGITVDGSDLMKVHEAAQEPIERARSGEGPTLIECKVARLCPHVSFLDDNRPEEVVQNLCEKYDPIDKFERYLIEQGIDSAELEDIKRSVGDDLDRVIDKIQAEPMPDKEDILAHVYASEVASS